MTAFASLRRAIPAVAAVALTAAVPAAAETWGIDPTHTDLTVAWDHSGFSTQIMSFYEFSGTLELDLDNVEAAKADFTVPVASMSTGYELFTNDLLGANFFDAENHPEIRFVSTSVTRTGDMTADVTGDMTIKGVTLPVTFAVEVHKIGEHPVGQFFDAYKGNWMGFTATATLNRSEFGIDAFIPIGSDEVTIVINSEMREGGFAM